MALKFKNPKKDNLRKVMVYGRDGSGKSTFAADYCKKHQLNPVVIDVDDTNKTSLFTEGRVLQIDMKTDISTFRNVKSTIEEIKKTEFDTIILDGVTSLLEMLTSDAKGLAQYSDRAKRFNKILQALLDSGKHIIFIGQIDMEVIYTEDFQSPKAVIKVNSLVNEKYLCFVDEKGNYNHQVKKYRTIENNVHQKSEPKTETKPSKPLIKEVTPKVNTPEMTPEPVPVDDFVTADEIPKENFVDDPVRNQCILIKGMLEREGVKVTKSSMRSRVVKLIKEEVLPKENRASLIRYIDKNCPEGLEN